MRKYRMCLGLVAVAAALFLNRGQGAEARFDLPAMGGSAVSPDDATLVVSYAGLERSRIPLLASDGATVTRDVELTSQIYRMQAFTVEGEREEQYVSGRQ